jgi:hypothetical protein
MIKQSVSLFCLLYSNEYIPFSADFVVGDVAEDVVVDVEATDAAAAA